MKTQKLFVFVIAVAAFLLVGASNATACCLEIFETWVVLGVESASGEQVLGTEVEKCVEGIAELQILGYRFKSMAQVKDKVNVLYFEKIRLRRGEISNVALFCYTIINQAEE